MFDNWIDELIDGLSLVALKERDAEQKCVWDNYGVYLCNNSPPFWSILIEENLAIQVLVIWAIF